MTIEELCKCSAAQLEALSDKELLEHFQKYLTVTRPELATKPVNSKPKEQVYVPQYTAQQKLALEQLAAEGVDLQFLQRRKKK